MISRRILYFLIATTVTAVVTAYAVNSPRWHAKDNALYIAQQLSPLRSHKSLDALNRAMEFNVKLLATSLEKNGWTIVDLDALTEAVKQELRIIEVLGDFEQALFHTYLDILSPKQLAGLAKFYKTDAGQWMAKASRTMVDENGVTRKMTPADADGLPPEFAALIAQFLESDTYSAVDGLQAEFDAVEKDYHDANWSEDAKMEDARTDASRGPHVS